MKLRNKKTGEILETVRSAMVNKDKFRIYDFEQDLELLFGGEE